jgi:aquaporin Z
MKPEGEDAAAQRLYSSYHNVMEVRLKYVYEFIGTFFLVLTIGMVVLEPAAPLGFAPIAIGSVLAVMIFAGGHISGAHYNPAVSLAVFVRGKISMPDMLIYWGVQLVAGAVAGFLVLFLKGSPPVTAVPFNAVPILVAEFLFTFALCFVVLNVATAKGTEGNSFYGLAIGFTVLAGAYAVGTISGGAFNPAVVLGGTVMGFFGLTTFWAYLIPQLAGAAVAALVFKQAHPGE